MFKNITLRRKILISIILNIFLIFMLIFYLGDVNIKRAENEIAKIFKNNINYQIKSKIEDILTLTKLISLNNDSMMKINPNFIYNDKNRDIYFTNSLKNIPILLSSYITTAEGYQYGATRGEQGDLGVFDLDKETNNTLKYYIVDEKLNRILYKKRENYDPTLKPWYQQAVESNLFLWTEIYPSSNKNSLVLTGVKSIIEDNEFKGVAASAVSLDIIDKFLEKEIKNAKINIIDSDGFLIASSKNTTKLIKDENLDLEIKKLHIKDLKNDINEIYQYLSKEKISIVDLKPTNLTLNIATEKHYVFLEPFIYDNLKWIIIIDLKRDILKNYLVDNKNLYIYIFFILIIGFIYVAYELTKFNNSVSKLNRITNDYSKGEFQKRLDIQNQNNCLSLSQSVNFMANEIENIIQQLEEKIKKQNNEIQILNKKITDMSSYDSLTKLYNRNNFFRALEFELKRNDREKTPLTLILCDIDLFHNINEMYGYNKGDDIIEMVAITIKNSIKRTTDVVARFSGEEFILILPNTELQGALNVAQKIQTNVSKLKIEYLNGEFLTVSIGVITTIPDKTITAIEFVKSVNEALFEAKKDGRNKIAYRVF